MLSVFAACCSAATAQQHPFVGTSIVTFEHHEPPAMMMPTDVAVDSAGHVFIADGVHDRILKFDRNARLVGMIRSVGPTPLESPLGVSIDARDRLFVADTGNGRVLVFDASGQVEDIITPTSAGDESLDLTDVAVSPDGRFVWMVDNERHRLLRLDVETKQEVAIGRLGESIGQLNHPFMIAIGAGGDVHVTDVINGRIMVFGADGRPIRGIGGLGVDIGDFFRAEGVAVDEFGNTWVSDGVTNVIQIFSPSGVVIDVLRNERGEPYRFEHPMGIRIAGDDLYVTELRADLVRRVRITRGPIDVREARPRRKPDVVGRQARSCTVCHIEWMPPFDAGRSTPLMSPPESTPQLPAVSRSEMCLSCHDGSIVDSRRRVWLEHGHRTGISPSDGMKVPSELPLADGKIMCRTCHSAHTGGDFTGNMRTSVFLRVENSASQLCIGCHEDHTRGPSLGTHPTGGMPWPVPRELIAAGAKVGPNPREITCQVCHTPHGSSRDHLLVMGTESNQLCLTCHDQMRPGMFREGDHTEHPISPIVNAEQKAAITMLGTKLGPEERLICLSCHKLHHGKGERFMLAAELTGGEMCISCHSEKRKLLGTSHDLRQNFPNERNRLGMTADTGGPCSSCHMFHRYARAPEPHPYDQFGQCFTCHQKDRCAENRPIQPANHPSRTCTGCHDPHEPRFGCYLRSSPTESCLGCHTEQSGMIGGMHDMRSGGASWPDASMAASETCMACHKPHGASPSELFRVTPVQGLASADATCAACHSESMWQHGGALSAVHPRHIVDAARAGDLPLVYASDDEPNAIGCATCHDPHSRGSYLARVREGESPSALCVQCHSDYRQVLLTAHAHGTGRTSAHDSRRAGADGESRAIDALVGGQAVHGGSPSDSCRACHSVHADPMIVSRQLLSRPPAQIVSVREGWMTGEDVHCSSCHRPDGEARPPAVASHPDVPMMSLLNGHAAGALPLFDDEGRIDAQGRITCRTCHIPHGQQLSDEHLAAIEKLPVELRRPIRLLLRPFDAPNVCTQCHGADGLWRFLYYHDSHRRGGPDVHAADYADGPDAQE